MQPLLTLAFEEFHYHGEVAVLHPPELMGRGPKPEPRGRKRWAATAARALEASWNRWGRSAR